MKIAVVIAGVVLAMAPARLQAQSAPISRTVQVTFTGVVSSTAADTLLVRQPDGSFTSFAGALPELPYLRGDPVTISFNATLPTRAYYDSGVYQGQIAADGIYRISVANPFYSGGTTAGGIGTSTSADVSGPINPALNFGQPTNTRMTIVYDYNTDTYSIEGGGNFASGAYAGPGYIYDAATGSYLPCSGGVACNTSASQNPVLSSIAAGAGNSATSIQSGNFLVRSTDLFSGTGTGFFSWLFTGSWNLPQFGGATAVPEPGMLGLFGGGLAVLVWRRRKRKAA
jgi:hypothetical protein